MNHNYVSEVEAAIESAQIAARLCRSVQSRLGDIGLEKDDRSPVTVADFASQAIICERIRGRFPSDPIMAEEDATQLRRPENERILNRMTHELSLIGITASREQVFEWIDFGHAAEFTERFWTLDPIDGTKGFLRGDQYAIALSLIIDGEVEVAVLACPNWPLDSHDSDSGTLFGAVREQGSWSAPLDDLTDRREIRVSDVSKLETARMCESFESGHSAHDRSAELRRQLQITNEPLRIDSQAKYAILADGKADIYLRLPTRPGYVENIWDHAAGALIVSEAGGRVSDITGNEIEFHHGMKLAGNRGLVVTNGLVHDAVLNAL